MAEQNSPMAGRGIYAGLFLIALSSLLYELLLTRIFSVTLYYHFAFAAVSAAMFGLTVGAMLVMMMLPDIFKRFDAPRILSASSIFMSLFMAVYIAMQVFLPPQSSIYGVFLTQYVVAAIPFIFTGICVSLIISTYAMQVETLYAADLIGSALGCLAAILIFFLLDGPTAVIAAALIAAVSGLFFLHGQSAKMLRTASVLLGLGLFSFVCFNAYQISKQDSLLRLRWTKNMKEPVLLYEKWNHFSRIKVNRIEELPEHLRDDFLRLDIDASAATFLTRYNGDPASVSFLRKDVQNVAHALRPQADVCVIGAGAGRDLLSALAFEQRSIRAIEMNQDILHIVNGVYGDFTGHLDRYPQIRFVNDEARSYLSRTNDRFDIIQVSLIDTWAATAAGAFALSENGLYTVEAWDLFLSRLKDDGVLTFTRWYFEEMPGEMYRLVSLAHASLVRRGITDPGRHMLIAKDPHTDDAYQEIKGTLLVSPSAFTPDDIVRFTKHVEEHGLVVVMTPEMTIDPVMAEIASHGAQAASVAALPVDVRPSMDDWPFFFNMLRVKDALKGLFAAQGMNTFNMDAVTILVNLSVLILLLAISAIILPLLLTFRDHAWRNSGLLTVFFIAIGFGFMFIEIALLQRLSIYLGHPTYSLAVVLFSLLLATGLGSYLTNRMAHHRMHWRIYRFYLLVLVLSAAGLILPWAVLAFDGISMVWRIVFSLFPVMSMGLFMGMAFPLGMTIAAQKKSSIIPWFWGVNGATSVCASVFAIVIAMHAGVMTVYWFGVGCYAVAFICFWFLSRRQLD